MLNEKPGELVGAYYDPNRPFAGELFDEYGNNPRNQFTADDIVAASLLDVRFGPRAVRRLLVDRTATKPDFPKSADQLLAEIPDDEDLWEGKVDLSRQSPAWQLWMLLDDIPGIGGTRASKLMARKRPRLFPIVDSVIKQHLKLGNMNAWTALREVLSDGALRRHIDNLAPAANRHAPPTTLRLLDVLTWMRYSNSRNAQTVRRHFEVGV
jgi:hypothetical protein